MSCSWSSIFHAQALIIAIIHSLVEKSNRLVWKLCILVVLGVFVCLEMLEASWDDAF